MKILFLVIFLLSAAAGFIYPFGEEGSVRFTQFSSNAVSAHQSNLIGRIEALSFDEGSIRFLSIGQFSDAHKNEAVVALAICPLKPFRNGGTNAR